jgi:hypothetical protein
MRLEFSGPAQQGGLAIPVLSTSGGDDIGASSADAKRGIRVSDTILIEIRDLLVEVRDLLRPVADAHQDDYDQRQAEREKHRTAAIAALLSTDKRKKAWALADGSLSQREIAKKARMDEGGASKFFKSLRELGALSDSTNPARTIEVSP